MPAYRTEDAKTILVEKIPDDSPEGRMRAALDLLDEQEPEPRVSDHLPLGNIPPWLQPQGIPYDRSDDLDAYLEEERERNCGCSPGSDSD